MPVLVLVDRDHFSAPKTSKFYSTHPARSSCLLKTLECRSTSSWMSLIFIFSRSSCISFPSSTPITLVYFEQCHLQCINFEHTELQPQTRRPRRRFAPEH